MTQSKHTPTIEIGTKVKCLSDNIDSRFHKGGTGEIGYVTGFARFSPYHPREVYVSKHTTGAFSPDGKYDVAPWCGWFWEADVEPLAAAKGDA